MGDLDVVDGAPRSVTCIALDEGCVMVQLPRPLFMAFVRSHPQALLLYLQQGLARLWRVAHFMLSDFLQLTLHKPQQQQQQQQQPAWSAPHTSGACNMFCTERAARCYPRRSRGRLA